MTPAEQVKQRFFTDSKHPTNHRGGTVEVWKTNENRLVLVLPMWEEGGLTQEGCQPDTTEMKMLWFDHIDQNWSLSDLENRLKEKIGELNLVTLLETGDV